MAVSKKKVVSAARNGKRKSAKKSNGKGRRTLVGGRQREQPDPTVPLPEPTATFTL